MGRIVGDISREIISYLDQISRAWTDFWFTPRDPFSLSVMRCLVGWMAFYSTLVWGIELESFIFPHGYNSAEMINKYLLEMEGPYALSFWFWTPVSWIYPIHYLCLAITFCFMIGLFTRTTSILSLIILISYAYRARFSNYGLDQILTILTLYLCIAPSGAYLSVDRLLRRRRSIQRNLAETGTGTVEAVQPSISANIATRFVQFHMCVIYLAAGTGKLYGESWWDGSAMWRSLANAEYQTLDMTWLAYYPWFTQLMTHLTIFWEVSFAFLVWRPLTRPVVLMLGLGMHFGIGLFMGMWTFATCMMFGYCAFVEPQMMKLWFRIAVESLWGNTPAQRVLDRHDTAAINQAVWQKTLDLTDRLTITLAEESPLAHVEDLAHSSRSGEETVLAEPEFREVLLLEQQRESAAKTAAAFRQQGIDVRTIHSFQELQARLKHHPESGVIVNLEGMSERDVQDYLTHCLPISLRHRPSVTILRGHQAHWLDETTRQDYQRILLLPCEREEMLAEFQRAVRYFLQPRSAERVGAGATGRNSDSFQYSVLSDSVLN